MGYETPYPEPSYPHPRTLTEITESPHASKWVQKLITFCSNDVTYMCLNILKVLSKLKKWLGRKLTFITVKGNEIPYRKRI